MDYINKILNYKKYFSYDVEDTIKNIMKKDKVTQNELARKINMNERTIRRYLNKEIKITKVVLGLISVGLNLPNQIIQELYINAKIYLCLSEEDVLTYNAVYIEKNVEKMEALIKLIKK